MNYGVQFYTVRYDGKTLDELIEIRKRLSVELYEVNAELAALKLDYLEGFGDRIAYHELCQQKASIELEFAAIKQSIQDEIKTNTREYFAEKHLNDSEEKLATISQQLLKEIIKLKEKRTALNGVLSDGEIKELLEQKRCLAIERCVCDELLKAARVRRKPDKKDTALEKKVHTAKEYDRIKCKSNFLYNAVKLMAQELPKDTVEAMLLRAKEKFMQKSKSKHKEAGEAEIDQYLEILIAQNKARPSGETGASGS
jgi:hypothetical protein